MARNTTRRQNSALSAEPRCRFSNVQRTLPQRGSVSFRAETAGISSVTAGCGDDSSRGSTLSGIGVEGWLLGGGDTTELQQISVAELGASQRFTVLDVRRPAEWRGGHIHGSVNVPLDSLRDQLHQLDRTAQYAVHCKSGYRSSIACSLLLHAGFRHIANVVGGIDAWIAAGFDLIHEPIAAAADMSSASR